MSWAEYQALSTQAHSFSGIIAEDRESPRVRLPDRDDLPITAHVSDNYFDVLSVKAARGDLFHSGKGCDQTIVISDHYWKTALAGDPAILGRPLQVGPGVLSVIGILPPRFQGTWRGLVVDLFNRCKPLPVALGVLNPADLSRTDFELVARLRPGVSLERARSETDAVLRQVENAGQAPGPQRRAILEPFAPQQLSVKIVFLATLLLLVAVAAVNVANLRSEAGGIALINSIGSLSGWVVPSGVGWFEDPWRTRVPSASHWQDDGGPLHRWLTEGEKRLVLADLEADRRGGRVPTG